MRQIRDVILCKDCGLRRTDGCPMFESCLALDESSAQINVYDKTNDYGFCHMGTITEKMTGQENDKDIQIPLSLGYILSLDSIGDAFWVEYSDGRMVPMVLTNDCHQYGEQLLDGCSFKLADYKKSWRCWRSKPTQEERRSAKWQ